MSEQMTVINLEPVIDTSLHNMCVRLGGVTPGKYTMLTGERTDHILIEFIRRDAFCTKVDNSKN